VRLGRSTRADKREAPALIYTWDLDKTYLKSEFETLREMVRIPFEKAEDKVAAPGVAALIRALRDAAGRRNRPVRVRFVSASPPQIGRAIREKLALDGIVYDAIVFKDQLHRLMRGKFRHLREQVGFKLTELLKARREATPEAREYLFGDDGESDPLIYSLYADVIAGRVEPGDLDEILRALRVDPPLIGEAVRLARELPRADVVERIFINLERRTPPARFRSFGARLVPAFNYFQTAACLFEEGVLDAQGVTEVARALIDDFGYSPERLANSLSDIERRGHLDGLTRARLQRQLGGGELPPVVVRPAVRLARWWRRLRSLLRPAPSPVPLLVDYRAMVTGEPPAGEGSA
jgi:hypothetical protein